METVPQPEKKEWEDNPLAVRAVYRVLPFLDRTVSRQFVPRFNNETHEMELWQRTIKQSGREILRHRLMFVHMGVIPSAEGHSEYLEYRDQQERAAEKE